MSPTCELCDASVERTTLTSDSHPAGVNLLVCPDCKENGLPQVVVCDRTGCPRCGVTSIDGVRLCRPHEREERQ